MAKAQPGDRIVSEDCTPLAGVGGGGGGGGHMACNSTHRASIGASICKQPAGCREPVLVHVLVLQGALWVMDDGKKWFIAGCEGSYCRCLPGPEDAGLLAPHGADLAGQGFLGS